jgi:hypothetical protein
MPVLTGIVSSEINHCGKKLCWMVLDLYNCQIFPYILVNLSSYTVSLNSGKEKNKANGVQFSAHKIVNKLYGIFKFGDISVRKDHAVYADLYGERENMTV